MVPQPKIRIWFKHCEVLIWSEDYLETRFEDGLMCPALFDYGDESTALAVSLGYPNTRDGVRQMHIDHELAHTYLTEREGLRWSRCLHAAAARLASGQPWQHDDERANEEGRVLAFQRRLNSHDTSADVNDFRERFKCCRSTLSPTS